MQGIYSRNGAAVRALPWRSESDERLKPSHRTRSLSKSMTTRGADGL